MSGDHLICPEAHVMHPRRRRTQALRRAHLWPMLSVSCCCDWLLQVTVLLLLVCFPQKEDGLLPKPPSSGGEEEEKPRGEASEDLCEMALDPELLLLRDDGEEEFGRCRWVGRGAGGGWWRPNSGPSSLVRTGARLAVWPPLRAHLRLSIAGAKLEDSEVRSVASNQSEMEFSSLQDMVRPLFGPSDLSDSDIQEGLGQSLDTSAK